MFVPAPFFLFAPDVEFAAQKTADPIELRIYPGADGDFTIYEDETTRTTMRRGPTQPSRCIGTISLQH